MNNDLLLYGFDSGGLVQEVEEKRVKERNMEGGGLYSEKNDVDS